MKVSVENIDYKIFNQDQITKDYYTFKLESQKKLNCRCSS